MDENEKWMTSPQTLPWALLKPTSRRPQSCDRFIPIRRKLNCDVLCQSLIASSPIKSTNSPASNSASSSPSASPSTSPLTSAAIPPFGSKSSAQEQFSPDRDNSAVTYRQQLRRAMEQTPRQRIFSFSLSETPSGPCLDRYPWNITHRFTLSPFSRVKQSRKFPHDPERVLSIPHIRDDFYSSVMDWGSKDCLALALGGRTYLWNLALSSGSNIEHAKITSGENQHRPSSVRWNKDGRVLAIGDTQGLVRFFESPNVISFGDGQSYQMCSGHIGCLEWFGSVLYCGSRDRNIYVIDTRAPPQGQGLLRSRRASAITSLKLSPDETLLACGCGDGVIRLWCSRTYSVMKEIVAHRSSIKALAWCPWNSSYLATGGGCNDGRIILWNINNGQPVSVQDTCMQTLDLVWSVEYEELISSHGSPDNSILVWSAKDLTLSLLHTLTGHQARPLHLALSPDKTTLASAGADETLCLWKLFPPRKASDLRASPVGLFGLR